MWDLIDKVELVLSGLAAVFSGVTWWRVRRDERRRSARIRIVVRPAGAAGGDEDVELPYRPRRDQITRGEITGLLGFYHPGEKRFDSDSLAVMLESRALDDVIDGTVDEFVIVCSRELWEAIGGALAARRGAVALPLRVEAPREGAAREEVDVPMCAELRTKSGG